MKFKYTIILMILLVSLICMAGCTISPSASTTTPTPQVVYVTVLVTPTPIPVATAVVNTNAVPQSGVWAEINYDKTYSGLVGVPGSQAGVSDTGDHFYRIPTENGIVAVSVQKNDASADELKVNLYNDGILVKTASTSIPDGNIDMQVSLATPTPTTDMNQYCSVNYPGSSYDPSTNTCVYPPTIPTTAQLDSPSISSVSTIVAANSQTIYIEGSGFGNTPPATMSIGDGSVDTVGDVTTPCMSIWDNGAGSHHWQAGIQTSPSTAGCAIGLYINKWSDNEIVLGGFGRALSTNNAGTWNIGVGDPLVITVFTPEGQSNLVKIVS